MVVDKSSDKRITAAATEEQWLNRICRYEAGLKTGSVTSSYLALYVTFCLFCALIDTEVQSASAVNNADALFWFCAPSVMLHSSFTRLPTSCIADWMAAWPETSTSASTDTVPATEDTSFCSMRPVSSLVEADSVLAVKSMAQLVAHATTAAVDSPTKTRRF